mmetsp:Transcript_21850/g.85587  ORF Transcript_21850/g.85587 Transcript_21850/m.85587 type:complete len:216 (-) Transcript_21850:924-1571(-)
MFGWEISRRVEISRSRKTRASPCCSSHLLKSFTATSSPVARATAFFTIANPPLPMTSPTSSTSSSDSIALALDSRHLAGASCASSLSAEPLAGEGARNSSAGAAVGPRRREGVSVASGTAAASASGAAFGSGTVASSEEETETETAMEGTAGESSALAESEGVRESAAESASWAVSGAAVTLTYSSRVSLGRRKLPLLSAASAPIIPWERAMPKE